MRKAGLIIFLCSLTVFLVSLSLGNYRLTHDLVQQTFYSPESVEYFFAAEQQLIDHEFGNQFAFTAALDKTFSAANSRIVADLGITDTDVQRIGDLATSSGAVNYSESILAQAFPGPTAPHAFKKKALFDHTGWMFGREYADKDAFLADLNTKVPAINRQLIADKGFPDPAIKDLKFSLTKASTIGIIKDQRLLLAIICFLGSCLGALLYILPGIKEGPPGIKNNHIFQHASTNRGWIGMITGGFLIGFYILLYWWPEYITNWVLLLDGVSLSISGNPASQWFLYGFMYCLAMVVMGIRMIIKYRHSNYQMIRTVSVIFFQVAFAFLIPEILVRLNQPYMDLKNIWPLDYDFFFNGWLLNYDGMQQEGVAVINGGRVGFLMLVWGIALIIVGVPVLVYFYGKRWYCSWVCGCGGLAETLGDPYRQLSDKSLNAWKVERWLIHSVLVFAVLMTGLTLYTFFSGSWTVMGIETVSIQKAYGFLIGSAFAGVVGTGFYPLMGNRVWCRFGCPLAAYLGLVQKFRSRFRITVNKGQCISCGNCSAYCEMGIDVRWYAQRGQNIIRSSCVGCGICSAVCPRGVLSLENGPEKGRYNGDVLNQPIHVQREEVDVLS